MADEDRRDELDAQARSFAELLCLTQLGDRTSMATPEAMDLFVAYEADTQLQLAVLRVLTTSVAALAKVIAQHAPSLGSPADVVSRCLTQLHIENLESSDG